MHSLRTKSLAAVLGLLPLVGLAQGVPPEGPPAALSVCAVFENMEALTGKVVTVRGHLRSGRETFALGDPKCASTLKGTSRDWPRVINLIANPIGAGVRVPFEVDRDALQRADRILAMLNGRTQEELGVEVMLTVVGEFRSIAAPERFQPKTAAGVTIPVRLDGPGFGHVSSFPAEIRCQTIKDITIRQVR